MANDDKLFLAYAGELGESAQSSTRERVDWILSQITTPGRVLDIGCSQGIISILLAENGNEVTGLDIQKEAIEFSNKLLIENYNELSNLVEFHCIDFMEYETNNLYDYIVMTEILEHLQDPSAFIVKAFRLLKNNGKVIISVPFGIMNHPDHYNTYYLSNFMELLNKNFKISDIVFIKRWMGAIACNKESDCDELILNRQLILLEEENFLVLDTEMNKRISELYEALLKANEKYKAVTLQYKLLGDNNKKILEEIKNTSENLKNFMIQDFKDLTYNLEIINDMKLKMQRMSSQNLDLVETNETYRLRLEKIDNNILFSIQIKIYRKLKSLKRKLIGWLKK